MFDGSFKTSRKVNLSGRRRPFASTTSSSSTALASASVSAMRAVAMDDVAAGSKQELLLQSKRAREERLVQKRMQQASVKIQTLVRRVQTDQRTRATVFLALEQALTHVVTTSDIRATVVPTATLVPLVRQFLFATRAGAPSARLTQIAPERVVNVHNYLVLMLLVSCLKGAGQDANYLAVEPKDAQWYWQVTRLVEVTLRTLVTGPLLAAQDQPTSPHVLLLETLTNAARYSAQSVPRAQDVVDGVLLRSVATRTTIGLFDALVELVRAERPATDRISQLVVEQCTRVLSLQANSEQSTAVTIVFAEKILSVPCAINSVLVRQILQKPKSESNHSHTWFWERALGFFLTRSSSSNWTSVTRINRTVILGNILDVVAQSPPSPELVRVAFPLLSQILSPGLLRWVFANELGDSSMNKLLAKDPDAMEIDEDDDFRQSFGDDVNDVNGTIEDFVKSMREEADAISSYQIDQGLLQRVRAQCRLLCDSAVTSRVFSSLLASSQSDSSGNSMVSQVCEVYSTVLLSLGSSQVFNLVTTFAPPSKPVFAFLNAVQLEPGTTGSPSVINSLWQWITKELPVSQIRHGSDALARARVLLVFNSIFSHILLALDDETFYERSWPLRKQDLASVVEYLKLYVFETCWNVSSGMKAQSVASGKASVEDQLLHFAAVTSSVQLFNQLYDRDCRRGFLADSAWLWPAMPVIIDTVNLEAMEGDVRRAQALWTLMRSVESSTNVRAALVLTTIPQVFKFDDRVALFEKLLEDEKRNHGHIRNEFGNAIQIRVKRDDIVDDSFAVFHEVCAKSTSALKARIKVTFINEQGLEEAGIDGGGVFREYMDVLTKSAFSPEYGFFLVTEDQLLYPNHGARVVVQSPRELADRFRFLGRILGKAVYEGILVEPQFAAFFLNKLLGKFNYIDDLHSLDPELYRNLMQLKHYNGNVEDLALTFSVNEVVYGETITRDLIPGGASIMVTNENRIRYIHLMANYKLNVQTSNESAAFLRGFRDMIPAKWIQLFSPSELQMLIGGSANKIDVADWKNNTVYSGGYHPSQAYIEWFWSIVNDDFTAEDQSALLKFITSCSRQPLLGFAQLDPRICIHQVRIDDDERLPSSATCMNLLKLPTYSGREIMKTKLLYAIKSNSGFDLS
ncbi:TPA: hypothetical protein N0F65_002525 [Lagenidium giganteum]|uniref:HECT-type E3 ubiquitin transferase n=1 Tax=Lagenidium giganteum TaxID=4803 RepID=A0AAV2YMK6_9STRA|nr:TPA: hypothetical protein N0F65_002525 [Lagenidium giganteum]